MQIRELVLYGYNGKVRHLPFALGQVNIITGRSKSGKSVVGDIKAVDLEKLISAVYISPYAPKWFEDVVRNVMQKYELNKPLYYSEMLNTPFY